ncbi:MAG: hypothetical protein MJ182_04030 [Treponema sp.]|nr:hypothetical protein [Treponema sp.]
MAVKTQATPSPARAHKIFPQAIPQKRENLTSPKPSFSFPHILCVIKKIVKIPAQEIRAGIKDSKQKNAAASPVTKVPKYAFQGLIFIVLKSSRTHGNPNIIKISNE